MDHLPVPSYPLHPSIKVPLRCNPSYGLSSVPEGRSSFSEYPESQGWEIERVLIGDIGPDPRLAESFLQEWLYFGLMSEVLNSCGLVVTEFDKFIANDENGTKLVTTATLPETIEKWKRAKSKLASDEQLMIMMQVDDVLSEARHFISRLVVLSSSPDWDLPMEEAILLSIIVLGQTLEFSMVNIFRNVTGGQLAPMKMWPNTHNLGRLLREEGCCLNHVRQLEETVTAPTMYYAYRSGVLRDKMNHEKCTADKCVAYQIDPQEYQTIHREPGCSCDHLQPPMDKVRSILSKGGFPVISLTSPIKSPSELDLDIDVTEPSNETLFVAISHVWSDGLGNPRSNSLPRCQLQHLRVWTTHCLLDKGAKEWDRVHFWIDTLCVPLDEPYQSQAVELIKTTFVQATEVLVLDARLNNLSSEVDYTENMMRVTCGSWMRRLWTFLEGVLAKKLSFRFADRAVEIQVWMLARYEDKSTDLWNVVSVDASQFYWLLRRLERYNSSMRVARIWNALQWRSTSCMSDESICVASLFGLDLPEIVRTPNEQRMLKLLKMQRRFPPGIIFMNAERLKDKGFRWAPQSLLARQRNELALLNDGRPLASFNQHGLHVEFPGFLLTVPKKPVANPFLALDKKSDSVLQVTRDDLDLDTHIWDSVGPHALGRPAIISNSDPLDVPELIGILVDVDREEGNCFYVNFAIRVLIRREPTDSQVSHRKGLRSEKEHEMDEYLYTTATILPSN